MTLLKFCIRCLCSKPIQAFNVRSDFGTPYSWCKSCASKHNSRMRGNYRRAA